MLIRTGGRSHVGRNGLVLGHSGHQTLHGVAVHWRDSRGLLLLREVVEDIFVIRIFTDGNRLLAQEGGGRFHEVWQCLSTEDGLGSLLGRLWSVVGGVTSVGGGWLQEVGLVVGADGLGAGGLWSLVARLVTKNGGLRRLHEGIRTVAVDLLWKSELLRSLLTGGHEGGGLGGLQEVGDVFGSVDSL